MDLDDEELKATRRMNGSDKNVVCMEEDVKHIEYVLDLYKENGEFGGRYISGNLFEKDFIAIEHLIKAYKELEEKNRKLKEHCKEQIKDKQELTTALLDSIPVSLVEEKIKELKEEGNYKTLENPDGRVHFQAEPCDYKIQVLEELLEKR